MRSHGDAKHHLTAGDEARDGGLAVGVGFFTCSQHGRQYRRLGVRAGGGIAPRVLLKRMREHTVSQCRVRRMHASIRRPDNRAGTAAAVAARVIRHHAAPRKLGAEGGDRHHVDDAVLGAFNDRLRKIRK